MQILSDSVASLPIHAVRNGQQLAETPKILKQPDPSETRIDTVAAMMTSLLIDGNAYAVVASRDQLGFATSLMVLAPSSVSVMMEAGATVYRVAGNEIDPADMVHVRGVTLPGHMTGLGPLAVQRRSIGQAIAGEDYAAEMFTGGSIPSGVIHVDAELNREEAETLKTRFVAAHGGRQRTPAVLSGGVKYEPLGFSASDLELLESRRYNAQAICTIFGVPGFLVGVGSADSMTYSNVQQDSQLFVRFTLRPWVTRLEASLSALLPRGQEAQFNLDALLRANTLERYQAHSLALSDAWMTTDEVRAIENLEPLTDALRGTDDE